MKKWTDRQEKGSEKDKKGKDKVWEYEKG